MSFDKSPRFTTSELENAEDLSPSGQLSAPGVRKLKDNSSALIAQLSASERKALKHCERIVVKGAVQFIAVGLALKEIKDRKLYRETHTSFQEYCLDRFGFKRAHGYRLIDQATAVLELRQLSPNAETPLPKNESQARELAAVMAEMRAEVMKLASTKADGKPITAKLIREAAVELGVSQSTKSKLIPSGGDDCVNTPDWLAQAIVQRFMPAGRVLDPCRGGGAFFRAFPNHCKTDWCEIQDGRDFFQVQGHWDWVISNPPYSDFRRFLIKSMEIADNVAFLALANAWFVRARQDDIRAAGFGLVELFEVPVPKEDWPKFGMTLAAAWLRRGWTGGIALTRLGAQKESQAAGFVPEAEPLYPATGGRLPDQ